MSRNEDLQKRRDAAIARGIANQLPVFIERARNAELWDVEGRRHIDFASGIAVVNTGHVHPAVQAAADWLGTDPRVGDVLPAQSADGASRLEASFDGTGDDQAVLLRDMIAAGHRVVGFAQATSDLEEIFLKVTGQDDGEAAA